MIETRFLKYFLLTLSIGVLAGCKLLVISAPGGDTVSVSGARDCAGGNLCEFEISEAPFTETWKAVAKPGYQFLRWQGGKGFQCPDSTEVECTVKLGAGSFGMRLANSFDTGFIMPVYKNTGVDTDDDGTIDREDEDDDNDGLADGEDSCPVDDNLDCGMGDAITGANLVPTLVEGKQWAQLTLFAFLSWPEINEVCPAPEGTCKFGGTLNGYDMTGWTWASQDDAVDLLNGYLVRPMASPGSPFRQAFDSPWGPQFALDSWIPIGSNSLFTSYGGWLADSPAFFGPDSKCLFFVKDEIPVTGFDFSSACLRTLATESDINGALFHREPM